MQFGLGKPRGMGKAGLETSNSRVVKEERSHAEGRGRLLADGLCPAPSVQGSWVVRHGNSMDKVKLVAGGEDQNKKRGQTACVCEAIQVKMIII